MVRCKNHGGSDYTDLYTGMIAGRAVINAAEKGTPFPLKRRDQLLDYILTLMGREDIDGWNDYSLELLHTQVECCGLLSL